ncbi:MAG: PEP-CTERM sorting domain-containing protein [Akkermansiaceae bacterium]|nr:PEP-CTERM sorting domain-containing protein [Verrucomicrobiales bacterium]
MTESQPSRDTPRDSNTLSRSQIGAPKSSPIKSIASINALLWFATTLSSHAIMAGGETGFPADSPANRLDAYGAASPFNAVGSLAISSGGFAYRGSATAISPNWILTAGHNLDLNDNGSPDTGLSINFNLPGFGVFTASAFYTCPGFTGFGTPSIQRDIGLLYLSTPLPGEILFPSLQGSLQAGAQVTLVGFGRSGFGDYGYTTFASLSDRRTGQNVIDSFQPDDHGGGFPAIFLYDFDSPDRTGLPGGSLGNNLETVIGPGDSGGPLLLDNGLGYSLVGVNTFIEGYGGRFDDIGGGVVLEPYLDWINQVTGLPVPEPSAAALLLLGGAFVLRRIRKRSADVSAA